MRYLCAFEVGQDPVGTKYELAVKLHAMKNGPTIKTMVKLPKPVKTDIKVCVIAEGAAKEAALKAGAVAAGTDEIFEQVGIFFFIFFLYFLYIFLYHFYSYFYSIFFFLFFFSN